MRRIRLPDNEKRMIEKVIDFGDAKEMFETCGEKDIMKKVLLQKVIDAAETFEEFFEAYQYSMGYEGLEDKAYFKMEMINPERTDYMFH